MKKILSCCLLIVVFLVGVAATFGYLAWRKREAVHNAGETGATFSLGIEAALETREQITRKLESAAAGTRGSQIVFSESDLQALITSALAEHPSSRDLVAAAREIRADVEDNSLELGVTLDIRSLQEIGLGEAQTEAIERILAMLPLVGDQDLYVGVRGVPGARDGQITLVDDVKIQIGFLSLALDDLADHLGISSEKIYSRLAFDVDRFAVESVEARRDELALEIRVE